MARNWIVLTAARAPHAVNVIVAYTEWDGYVALADEVVYSNPVDADGNAVDALWKVSGTVTLAGGVYTYLDPGTEPTLANRQRSQVWSAYQKFKLVGRTGHWASLREGLMQEVTNSMGNQVTILTQFTPLVATDKWAFHNCAKLDQAILGGYPIGGPLPPAELQALIDHDDNILRTLGPAWYDAQTMGDAKVPTPNCLLYAEMDVGPNANLYSDTSNAAGALRQIDGQWLAQAMRIRTGFDPESRTLGN